MVRGAIALLLGLVCRAEVAPGGGEGSLGDLTCVVKQEAKWTPPPPRYLRCPESTVSDDRLYRVNKLAHTNSE